MRALIWLITMLGAVYIPIACGVIRSILQRQLQTYGNVSVCFGSIFSMSVVLLVIIVGEAISQICQSKGFKVSGVNRHAAFAPGWRNQSKSTSSSVHTPRNGFKAIPYSFTTDNGAKNTTTSEISGNWI
ncbi:hypothetical protein V8C42DRAFT_337622 [Trichoderma barbatum]